LGAAPARALEAITVRADISEIDLTAAVEWHRTSTERILVSPPDGDTRSWLMDVRAREGDGNKKWALFALANPGNEQFDRLIVIPHDSAAGSGPIPTNPRFARVVTITANYERPERIESATADVFRITLDPGVVITYVAELRTNELARFYVWEPAAYKAKGSLR
jgi:hypothetical protein